MIDGLKNILRLLYPYSKTNIKRRNERNKFEKMLSSNTDYQLKIVIGSGQKYTEGWVPSEAHFLDLLKTKTWLKYFKKNEIDGLLAEHV